MLSLLNDPLLRARAGDKVERFTLPEALAAQMRDQVQGFPALRPHQRHAWHMFLAYIGALALLRGGRDELPETAENWTELLLSLTDGAEEPWSLVVPDLSKPAFLQPPVPENNHSVLKNTVPTPDALDVLITAKNFDLKSAVAHVADADDWIFALVSLQTMEGFLGAGNYGIARMNGGFSARPFLGLAPRGGPGAHLRRDIRALFRHRERTLDNHPFYDPDGIALVWLEPWDGHTSLRVGKLDPWFIEICRRIRFVPRGQGFIVRGTGTAAPRIDAKALNGVTGDFWAPVNIDENKAFSLDAGGFSYRVLCRLLFVQEGEKRFTPPPAMETQSGEAEMELVARGVTRGQGKTEGFHERRIPVHRGLIRAMTDPDRSRTVGELADTQKKEVKQISAALRFACAIIAIGGAAKKPGKDDYAHAEPFVRRLDAAADAEFFEALQKRDAGDTAARKDWLTHLIAVARGLLKEAVETIPCRSQDRWRARVRAPGAFFGALWKGPLTDDRDLIFPKKEEADA